MPIEYRKRFIRFSLLSTALILVAATGVLSGDEELKTVKRIKAAGGMVKATDGGFEVGLHLKARSSASEILPLLPVLKNVTWLNLANSNVTDSELESVSRLKSLRTLHLEKTKIGDAGIKHLVGLQKLEYLNLYGTKVTDYSIKELGRMKKLERLYVWQTQITKKGVENLTRIRPRLEVIQGIDLAQLADSFIEKESKEVKPTKKLDWVAVDQRTDAPVRSDNGINCQVWFENRTKAPVKLYWISYGSGELRFYATLKPKESRKQNTYSRNAWLITTEDEKPLGYFIAKDDDALAIIP